MADLKRSVVVVSEYTIKSALTGKGSRGSSPGAYVERYMARGQAVEALAPVQRYRTDDFIMRYMARESAVEHTFTTGTGTGTGAGTVTRDAVKAEMRAAQGRGGVAFGYGSASLSDESLRAASTDIQAWFDAGHTVLKTVISFEEDYLRRHGIIAEDFHCERRGDYRGHIDQMKLRMAIMHGLSRMAQGSRGSGGFDDLRYVGVIQVDTMQVHCHLAMVDAGRGRLAGDGTQRGKLDSGHFSRLRRGIEAWLDEKQTVARLSSAVGYERRNVTTFIKRWAHQRMQSETLPQLLLACLPVDRSLWRAGTRRLEMRKADRLVRELVWEQLEGPGSPMPAAMEKIRAYADQRREAERLSLPQWRRLVDQGRDQILERAVNGVYGLLRALPADELRIRTPMLEVMGMDYQHLAALARMAQNTLTGTAPGATDTAAGTGTNASAGTDPGPEPGASTGVAREDDLVSFGLRLRSYSSRLEHHRTWHHTYRTLARDWEKADQAGVAAADSVPLYDFYRYEADYHARCMAKYIHFLPVAADPSGFYEQQKALANYGQRLLALRALRADASLQRMKDADEAERLGRQIYDQPGGRLLTQGTDGRAILDERITTMTHAYEDRLEQLRADLAGSGLVLRVETDPAGGNETTPPADPSTPNETTSPGIMGDAGHPDQPGADTGSEVTGEETGMSDPLGSGLRIEAGAGHDFGDVKGIDLHHLGYDFATDVEVGERARRTFLEATNERRRHLIAAMEYLDRTQQTEVISELPVDDVAAMVRTATELEQSREDDGSENDGEMVAVLRSRLAELETLTGGQARRSAASSLDGDLAVRLHRQVEDVVRAESSTDAAPRTGAVGGANEHAETYETD